MLRWDFRTRFPIIKGKSHRYVFLRNNIGDTKNALGVAAGWRTFQALQSNPMKCRQFVGRMLYRPKWGLVTQMGRRVECRRW